MKKLLSIFALTITAITSLTLTTPQIEASTSNYNLIYTFESGDNYGFWLNNGNYTSSGGGYSLTEKISLINNSLIFNNNKPTVVLWWNNSTFLGATTDGTPGYWPKIGAFSLIPSNATHFALLTSTNCANMGYNCSTHQQFQQITVSYNNPTPYTIQSKDPFAEFKEVKRIFNDNSSMFWHDDDGVLRGTLAGENDAYADRTDPFNLSHEMLYLNIPLPANITQAGTYDLWLTLFDYNDQFVGTYRPTSNNISTLTLSNLGAYSFRINYTENYKLLPSWELFSYAKYNSQNAWLETFYNTNGSVLIQLHVSATNLYQPQSNLLFVSYAEPNTYDVRDYLTANNIALPTKEGHTLLGFQRDLGFLDFRVTGEPYGIETSYIFTHGGHNNLYYPIFEQNITYDVTFTDYDDSVIEVVTVNQGETAIPTQQPTRAGYVFAYWEPPVADIQGDLTTKAIYYVPITWRNTSFATIRIDQVIEGQMPNPPTLAGYTRTWTPTITTATEPTQYIITSEVVTTSGNEQNSGVLPIGTVNATGLTDLFTGVFGAIVGSLMILGTIDLFGLQLSSLFWLFFAGTGFMLAWKLLRG